MGRRLSTVVGAVQASCSTVGQVMLMVVGDCFSAGITTLLRPRNVRTRTPTSAPRSTRRPSMPYTSSSVRAFSPVNSSRLPRPYAAEANATHVSQITTTAGSTSPTSTTSIPGTSGRRRSLRTPMSRCTLAHPAPRTPQARATFPPRGLQSTSRTRKRSIRPSVAS